MVNRKYKHVFFDLDDTLWDFYSNANEALSHLSLKYKLEQHSVETDVLLQTFHEVNNELWELYRQDKIDKDYLRNHRFNIIFERLKNKSFKEHRNFGDEYLALCPTKKNLIEGAEDLLEYLGKRYHLHVITNGFNEIAVIKLDCSGLGKYFDQIVTSEEAKSKKPNPKIFEFALQKTGADRSESIMVGNDLEADIYGAMNAGIDQVFFNPGGIAAANKPTFEIKHLSQLQKIL